MDALGVDPAVLAAGGVAARLDGPVLHLRLDRPAVRNAQTPSTWRALAAVGAGADESVRVVVVTGAGPSFSAGLDRRLLDGTGLAGEPSLAELAQRAGGDLDATIAGFQAGFTWLADPRWVSVAGVAGHAVGAGLQLALACDLVVCADDAQLAMREPSLGLVPDLGGTGALVRAVGYAAALELCLTGRFMGADEAVARGLALAAVPRRELPARLDELVTALLAAPAGAARATKALLASAAAGTPATQQLARERVAQVERLAALAGRLG